MQSRTVWGIRFACVTTRIQRRWRRAPSRRHQQPTDLLLFAERQAVYRHDQEHLFPRESAPGEVPSL